jgi:hypothetical protein
MARRLSRKKNRFSRGNVMKIEKVEWWFWRRHAKALKNNDDAA